ncbi:MAG: ATP-binding cassette domain-containing protein [Candidatus Stygibacter australis]|nr:ATP-binding cassette domain-containing protein [Candidatus Stygibacter australis]
MIKNIEIAGAREHNLKGFDVTIPHNKLIVVTGVSGSGKSSLAYDIVFREGQRRYLESISAYARQFMDKAGRPAVDSVTGIRPAIAVRQNSLHRSSRSTVGTLTGVYDYLRLLYARYGKVEPGSKIELKRSLFSFNSKYGACEHCRGLGVVDEIDADLLIKDEKLTIRNGAFEMTTPSGYIVYSQVTMDVLNEVCQTHGFSVDIPWQDLAEAEKQIVLYGSEKIKVPFGKHTLESRMKWSGITARPREEGYYKGIMNIMTDILQRDRNGNILRFARTITCPECLGKRLRKEALEVKYQCRNIAEYSEISLRELAEEFRQGAGNQGEELLRASIAGRCQIGTQIGLGHLQLSRSSETISAGEGQRLKLLTISATQLRDMIYVFDEPSIGLHQAEIGALVGMLFELRDNGNTVLVVEHDPLIIQAADHLITIGPGAGTAGGYLIYSGEKSPEFKPEKYTLKKEKDQTEKNIQVTGANANNLERISVNFALERFNVITGVSGAGKTSLAESVLLPAIAGDRRSKRYCESINGHEAVSRIVKIDQKPIGRSPRSNAATYTGLMDDIRAIYAKQTAALAKGLGRGAFSFNTKGGRCEECEGAGVLKLGMHFLDDITMICPVCKGKRFKPEILEINWQGYNIAELLELSVSEMRNFFEPGSRGGRILKVLDEVGLGYLTLGQPATTISGGEAQRIKLATELARSRKTGTLYYLDEPTTGLHANDVSKLLKVLDNLVAEGNTVIVIEHDPQVIYRADRVIDLSDGKVLYEGSVKGLLDRSDNLTAKALRGEIEVLSKPETSRKTSAIEFKQVTTNNLQAIDVSIPRGQITAITGISGSGKSSLAFDTIYAEGWQRYLENLPAYSGNLLANTKRGELESFTGLGAMLAIRQQSSSHNRRSTLSTYSGIYDLMRLLYSRLGESGRLPASDFSFNNPAGACENCKGLGTVLSCDPYLLITHPQRSIYEGAMDGTKRGKYFGERQGQYLAVLKSVEKEKDLDFAKPFSELTEAEKEIIIYGTGEQEYEVIWNFARGKRQGEHNFKNKWIGFVNLINIEYERVHQKRAGEQLTGLMSEKSCPVCQGKRLQKRVLQVKIAGYDIAELGNFEISELEDIFTGNSPAVEGNKSGWIEISSEILKHVNALKKMGLGYLTPARRLDTLSGGEFQRLRIARQVVSGLTGVTFVLDEISRGLHPIERKEVNLLLRELADNGNTVICVEHDPLFIKAADHVIELGPGAGKNGGKIIACGSPAEISRNPSSMIRNYLHQDVILPAKKRKADSWIEITGAMSNNLQNIDLKIPAGVLVGICGVSGSGKSTLCREVIYRSYLRKQPAGCTSIKGLDSFNRIIYQQQSGFNKNALSTPATYLGYLKEIGKLLAAETPAKAAIFNYAGKQGQCPQCKGTGKKREELDFAGYITSDCELCGGTRYHEKVLQYSYKGKNIADIMNMTISEAIDFFADHPKLADKLQETENLGLGYLQLGQGTDTLSGGEGQRLLLAAVLQTKKTGEKCLILLDEPTAGLHPIDIENLYKFLDQLVENQHTVIFIEHNTQLLAKADHQIELGPGAGKSGGRIIREM